MFDFEIYCKLPLFRPTTRKRSPLKKLRKAQILLDLAVAAVRSFVRSSAYGLHDLNSPPLPCPGLFPTHKGTAASLPSAAASARTAATPIYY